MAEKDAKNVQSNELKELKELVAFLKENEIAEFERTSGDTKVRIKFASAVAPAAGFDLSQLSRFAAPAVTQHVATAPAAVAAAVEPEEQLHEVKSPIVGTFYESSAPGAAPFVGPGDIVEVGQVICIVEAMKLMNEIESDVAGEIVRRIANNGQPVEYGQPLFAVRPRS